MKRYGLLLGLLALADAAFAAGTLIISGRVTSPTGTPISGVKVSLTGAATRSYTTGTNGAYSFTGLAAGAYKVATSKTGLLFCAGTADLPKLRVNAVEDFTGSAGGCQAQAYAPKATVVIYDPLITKADGSKVALSAYMGWEDPQQLVARYRRSIQSITNGRVRYGLLKTVIVRDFHKKADGFKYTQSSYLACMADHNACHMPDAADVLGTLASHNVCTDANAGLVDELWMFGGPYFGYYESQLTGPKAFDYNSPPLAGSACNKLLPIMGFNYERSLAEMLHDNMHRTEATMSRVYGGWAQNRTATNWDRFGLVAFQSPDYAYSGCGNGHWAPTSTSEYDYANPNPVLSNCDDFFNYPNLKPPGQALKTTSCKSWGCEEVAFYRYFFQHLPKASGTGPDGKFNDWWRYLIRPNDIFLTEWNATCSSELEAGWCGNLLDNAHGVCNEHEWSTASLPTGWAQITFPLAKAVTSVTIFDRACGEQVLAGHLEFSDGSAPIAFGALEDGGIQGTTVSFPAKNLKWVKVVIDESAGVNVGLSEIVVK